MYELNKYMYYDENDVNVDYLCFIDDENDVNVDYYVLQNIYIMTTKWMKWMRTYFIKKTAIIHKTKKTAIQRFSDI